MSDRPHWDSQFRETEYERNERQAAARKRTRLDNAQRATSITLTPEQSTIIVALFDKAAAAKAAFGAPGDYGYGTKEGDALFGLARALVEAHPVIAAIKNDRVA